VPIFLIENSLFHGQLKALHLYDCLRANKSTSAWGLEARVPFLDKDFVNLAMSIDPAEKMVHSQLCTSIFPRGTAHAHEGIYTVWQYRTTSLLNPPLLHLYL
jgi:asparagine synthetase B (glutamine-hydrolysing)